MKNRQMRNILITGLPRSGTTMICHQLNNIDNSVALHEPMRPLKLAGLSAEDIIESIHEFFTTQRQQIMTDGTATSKSVDGQVPTNSLTDRNDSGKRSRILNGRTIFVQNVHDADFDLYIKHPAFFTALLPVLSCEMECYAAIRNPLSVLLSWRNTEQNIANGRLPAAELFDDDLAKKLSSEPDTLQRQFILIDYFFDRYARYLPERTIKYEDIINSQGRALTLINPAAHKLNMPLTSRNKLGVQNDDDIITIAEKLLAQDIACWKFYSRNDVEELFK